MDALINGLPNLKAHIASLKRFGQQVVVSLNHFANDNEEEIDVVRKECLAAVFASRFPTALPKAAKVR